MKKQIIVILIVGCFISNIKGFSQSIYSGGSGNLNYSQCLSFNPTSAELSGGGAICEGEVAPEISVDLIGEAPWTVTYLVDGVEYSVEVDESPFVFSNALEGDYTIISVTDLNDNEGLFNGNASLEITEMVNPSFTLPTSICEGQSLNAFPLTSAEGITGSWSPEVNNEVTTTYTFTPSAGQCANLIETSIAVNPTIIPTFTLEDNICEGDQLVAFSSVSTEGISGTWSPSPNNSITTTYTFSPNSGECAESISHVITVNPSPTLQGTANPQTLQEGESSQLTITTNGSTINWSPSVGLSCTNCQNPVAVPTESTEYTVEVTSEDGCTSKMTFFLTVDQFCPELFVPNLFSPNGDNNNDALSVYGTKCMKQGDFKLFNRWGEVVFETSDLSKSWDGYYKGKLIASGVYHYTLEAIDMKGEIITKSGQITIVH